MLDEKKWNFYIIEFKHILRVSTISLDSFKDIDTKD